MGHGKDGGHCLMDSVSFIRWISSGELLYNIVAVVNNILYTGYMLEKERKKRNAKGTSWKFLQKDKCEAIDII